MEIANQAAAEGNRPFAGIFVDENGSIVLEASNTVNTTSNAAAHAEINLLFLAGKQLGTRDLSQYIFLSNAASCPMCATALIKAKITRFYYGAPHEATMVPDITMDEVLDRVHNPVDVHGGILGAECSEQIKELSK